MRDSRKEELRVAYKDIARKTQIILPDIEKNLNENTSYTFFEAVGDYLATGDTGSNVSDLIIAIKE